jgi:hypothetical protein
MFEKEDLIKLRIVIVVSDVNTSSVASAKSGDGNMCHFEDFS